MAKNNIDACEKKYYHVKKHQYANFFEKLFLGYKLAIMFKGNSMFEITQTFSHESGFAITPFYMEGQGFIFLPKELENQLGYDDLAKTISNSESFINNAEYVILHNSNLMQLKELLRSSNSIGRPCESLYEAIKYSPSLIVLTESGLYTAIILSRKPNAKAFRRWITCEVLPSIREKGFYQTRKDRFHFIEERYAT